MSPKSKAKHAVNILISETQNTITNQTTVKTHTIHSY